MEMGNDKLLEMLMDIKDRVTRIEEATKHFDETERRSNAALTLAQQNEEEIKKLQNSMQWFWRTAVGAFVTIATGLITIWLGGH